MRQNMITRGALKAAALGAALAILLGGGVAYAHGPSVGAHTSANAHAGGVSAGATAEADASVDLDRERPGVHTRARTHVSVQGGHGGDTEIDVHSSHRFVVVGEVSAQSGDTLTVQSQGDAELTVDIAGAQVRSAVSSAVDASLSVGARVLVEGECTEDGCRAELVVVLPQPALEVRAAVATDVVTEIAPLGFLSVHGRTTLTLD